MLIYETIDLDHSENQLYLLHREKQYFRLNSSLQITM